MTFTEAETLYDSLLAQLPEMQRKGKSVPYKSINGHMFTLVNKDGELGTRIGEKRVKEMQASGEAEQFRSHNANMRGYIKLSDTMLKDTKRCLAFFEEAQAHVLTLKAK